MSSESAGFDSLSLGPSNISARLLQAPVPGNQSVYGVEQSQVVTSLVCDASPVYCSVKWLAIVMVVEIAFGIGCAVDFAASKDGLGIKTGLGIAAIVHVLVKPIAIFAWIKIFDFFYASVIALLVTISLPGGHLTYLLTFLVQGDSNLSAWIAVAFTLLSFVVLPFNLYVYASHWLLGDQVMDEVIAYPSILLAFLLMTIPIGVGLLLAKLRPTAAKAVNKVFHVLLVLTLLSFVTLAAIEEQKEFRAFEPNNLWIVFALTPIVGITSGLLLTSSLRQDSITNRTVAIDTMTQNGPLAAAILKIVFPSDFIGIYYILPLLYSLIQFLESLLFVAIVRYKIKREEEEKENAFFALGGVPVGRIRRISLHTIDRIRRSFTRSRSSEISDPNPADLQHDEADDEQDVFSTMARRHNLITMAIAEEEEQSTSSTKKESKTERAPSDHTQEVLSSISKEEATQFEDINISKSD